MGWPSDQERSGGQGDGCKDAVVRTIAFGLLSLALATGAGFLIDHNVREFLEKKKAASAQK